MCANSDSLALWVAPLLPPVHHGSSDAKLIGCRVLLHKEKSEDVR